MKSQRRSLKSIKNENSFDFRGEYRHFIKYCFSSGGRESSCRCVEWEKWRLCKTKTNTIMLSSLVFIQPTPSSYDLAANRIVL